MAKGENIFKRKDGRWEARYIRGYELSGKIKYGFCYGKTYKEAKEKVTQCKSVVASGTPIGPRQSRHRFAFYCDAWLQACKPKVKESTYVKMWHHASVRGIICNLTYTGVLRSGESRSQTLPHLQIIAPELYEAAQHIRTSRANSAEQERRVPLNTRGQSLLAGNVFCGHCGSRLALTTNGKAYPCKEDAHRIVKRVRYICYGKTRKQTECDGQTGYTAHILDGIIDKVVRQIFERMKAIPKSEIVNIRYREKMEERKALLKSAKSDYAKAAAELDTLRAEVIKSLRGESAFSQDLLGSLISDCETKCLEVQHTMEAAQAAYDEGQAMLDTLNAQYNDIISWADMYDSASMESKKMIVSCLIRRVEVYRDYRLHIDFNIDFEQFSAGLDISAIAA